MASEPRTGSEREPDVVIDAEEFEAARRDPRVRALHDEARDYAQQLVAQGHCPDCLVVNCECVEVDPHD